MVEQLVLLSIPGLRPGDLHDPNLTPTLHRLALDGASCPLVPTFPCVTSPVQATMLTGRGPREHGVIANGFYWPDRQAVEFWVAHHNVIERETFFSTLARRRPELTSAVWHAQNIKGADANWIVTPSPIHEPDGRTRLWCYSKPEDLYPRLLADLGHFPLQHYWGPLAGIQSTKWILEGALWLAERHAPNFHYIYIPHLDYAAQKYGPDTSQAAAALGEFDTVLGDFMERYRQLPGGERVAWVLAGEYALTTVTKAVHPNRVLREAGLLKVQMVGGAEHLDIPASGAFAMVDHQLAHVFATKVEPDAVADLFRGIDDVQDILVGRERAALGMDHPRAAPVILISRPDSWFTYYWWLDDAAAPPFARTVDIHAKPGYDPVELFIRMPQRQIPLDASLVKGSHGAPVTESNQRSVLLASHADLMTDLPSPTRDSDIHALLCRAFGIEPRE